MQSNPQATPRAGSTDRIRLLENMLDNLPSLVGYWDHQLINRYCNAAYYAYFNRTKEEILGQPMRVIVGENLFNQNVPHIEKVLHGMPQEFEREIPMADGTVVNNHCHYIPDVVEGKVVGFFVLIHNVTQLKAAAREKEHLYQQLSESYKMVSLGEMAGGIAHEINTPLAVMSVHIGLAEQLLAEETIDRAKLANLLGTVDRTITRIGKIITGLLHFSKDRRDEPFHAVNLKTIVEDTIPFCSEKFKSHGVQLKYSLEDLDFDLKCRPSEISQVLVNLLNNAFDAAENSHEKWIALGATDGGSFVDIAVVDSGHGVSAEFAERIMQPFFTTKDVGRGTGLGLSISKGITESHGGNLFLDTNSKVTRFVMRLPKTV